MTIANITPEQEALAKIVGKRNWDLRRNHTTYAEDMMGAPPAEAVRAEMEEMLRRDPDSTTEDYEEWLALYETNCDIAQQYDFIPREPGEGTPEDEEQRIGRVLHSDHFLGYYLRQRCHLRCWYIDGADVLLSGTDEAEAHSLGYESLEQMADAGWQVKERRPHEGARWLGLRAQAREGAPILPVCGVQAGYMAEYEVFHWGPHGERLGTKYRGWRTVLLRLILTGFVEEELARQVFGRAERPCAKRYNELLYHFRNRPRQERAGLSEAATITSGTGGETPGLPSATDLDRVAEEETTREKTAPGCPNCGRRYGNHNVDCPAYQAA